MPQNELLVAHQMGAAFDRLLVTALPPGVRSVALPAESAYEVPPDAQILLCVPPRAGNVVVPAAAPAGWPHQLKWLHTVSAGVDEFPRWAFDVPLMTCGRGSNSAPIAEFVLASLLAVAKRLPGSWVTDADQWSHRSLDVLEGTTLGLWGLGSIATEIARRALPFGMRVLAHRRSSQSAPLPGIETTDLATMLGQSDHVVITMPATPETRHLANEAAFRQMKPGAHLVNVSRGAIIDQTALLAALDRGTPGFASLDVTDPEPLPAGHPLYTHPRVHISPHISWSGGTQAASIRIFVDNLHRFLAGEDLANRVDPTIGY